MNLAEKFIKHSSIHHRGTIKDTNQQKGQQNKTQSRAEGCLTQEGLPKFCKNQEGNAIVEHLKYFESIFTVQEGLVPLFNILL